MISRTIALIAALLLAIATPLTSSVRAQDQQAPTVSKQEMARSKFRDLTERMTKLMAVLQQSEPEGSKIIAAGLQYVQEAKIHEDMAHVRVLLEKDNFDDALVEMTEVRKDLQKLYELLQNRNTDLRKLMEEIARLQALKDRVEKLAKEQGEEKEASARIEELQKHLKDIEAQKQRAEALLAQQKELKEQTNQLGMEAAAEATKPVEQKEGQLKEDTEKFAKDLEGLEKKDAEIKDAAAAAAAKAADPKAGEPKAGQPKAGEPKAGEPKPSEPKESKPGEGKCSGSAGQASKSMGQAQKQLSDKKPENALKDQQQAIDSLKKTVKELEQMAEDAKRELLKLPFEQLAKKQEDTQHATDTLSKEMEKSDAKSEDGENKPTPGKKRVQQAVPKQKAAAGTLKEYKPAKQKQQDAKEDLEAAQKELEDALAQLRQQLSDEVLRALEERFTAMLAKQRELSVQTKTLDRTRQNVLTANGDLPSALAEKIQIVAGGEGDLEVEASDAVKLLEEDGTTAVFLEMTGELKDVLHGVAKQCRANETGQSVQEGQAEVEDLLTLLINSLRREIEKRDGQPGNCNCNGQPPLVPMSAELKMLKYLQERVNKSTKEYDARPAEAKAGDAAKTDAEKLSSKQGRVQELMRKLAIKQNKENESEGGR
ncbi:MAG: hypothetical protein IT456_10195 [Planctomycetes bacterium]|nr:hypothetical protein [Planctomycetota bacterium]